MKYTLLVVDDEEMIRKIVKKYAENAGYFVLEASNGKEAIDITIDNNIDIIVMDVMMPEIDGFKAYQNILKYKDIPCIFLTALNEEFNRIYGFDIGADDYVSKPFSPNELIKRINVILKRYHNKDSKTLTFGGLEINEEARVVKIDKEPVELSLKEYELLLYLFINRGIALKRESIMEHVWGYDYFKYDRTLDTHIKLLRKHLKSYAKYITTIRGVGYRFEKDI